MKKTSSLLVYLKKDPKKLPEPASFVESIVDILWNAENAGSDGNEIHVTCEISDRGLVLDGFRHTAELKKILLRRPPFCPIRSLALGSLLEDLPHETKSRGVNIGVAVILESSDHSVLLTRRSRAMRTFPHVWVPPGGHMDPGETLQQAGMRELMEETGLKFQEVEDATTILGLWESAFPPMRHLGLPTRHHIVVYLHHKAKETAHQLNDKIQLERNEVDACTWICSCVAESIVATDVQFSSDNETATKQCRSFPNLCVKEREYVFGILLNNGGPPEKGTVVPALPLFAQVGDTSDNERVSTGTKYALKLWLAMLRHRS